MRILLATGSVALAIAGATPACADPDGGNDDAGFIQALRQAGITFASDSQAIVAAHAVCGLIDNGETGLQVVRELKSDNAGLTMDGAANFAVIAANSFCPQQLKGAK